MGGRGIAGRVRAPRRRSWLAGAVACALGWAGGCALPPVADPDFRPAPPRELARDRQPPAQRRSTGPRDAVVPAAHEAEPAALPAIPDGPAGVDDLVRLAVARNPRLAKATFAIDAAHGRYVQAGLYPNPDLAVNWDEIGDRTGPGGIVFPRVTQPIVTGRKLSLAQAVAAAEVDQSTLALLAERYAVVGSVRAAFYDAYALERRVAVLDELVKLADDAVKNGNVLLENKQIARLDLLQLQVERERFRAEAEAARRELPSARRALAALIGDPRMAIGALGGRFEAVPLYDPDRALEVVLASHPEVLSARVGVERAQAAVRRAEAEPIPNLNVFTGYIRQYENKSNDFAFGVNGTIPVWNRNQGGIRAAKAELGAAIHEVGRVENDLADRVAVAFRAYASALRRAEYYRTEIVPRAEETYDLSLKAFKGGQFEYLRVIQSQRAVAEARLEYNTALGRAWKAAAELSGLLLEEWWPDPPPAPAPMVPPTPPTGKSGP
jgi:outer membrane protein, heavy metal efflux system